MVVRPSKNVPHTVAQISSFCSSTPTRLLRSGELQSWKLAVVVVRSFSPLSSFRNQKLRVRTPPVPRRIQSVIRGCEGTATEWYRPGDRGEGERRVRADVHPSHVCLFAHNSQTTHSLSASSNSVYGWLYYQLHHWGTTPVTVWCQTVRVSPPRGCLSILLISLFTRVSPPGGCFFVNSPTIFFVRVSPPKGLAPPVP